MKWIHSWKKAQSAKIHTGIVKLNRPIATEIQNTNLDV